MHRRQTGISYSKFRAFGLSYVLQVYSQVVADVCGLSRKAVSVPHTRRDMTKFGIYFIDCFTYSLNTNCES